jgi:hypothetical protein
MNRESDERGSDMAREGLKGVSDGKEDTKTWSQCLFLGINRE